MTRLWQVSGILAVALTLFFAAGMRTSVHAQSFSGTTLTVTVTSEDVAGLSTNLQLVLIGTWTIAFADNGGYAAGKDNTVTAAGLWSLAGNELTLTDTEGDAACTGSQATGVYAVSTDGSTYALTPISDDCEGRVFLLTVHRFTVS